MEGEDKYCTVKSKTEPVDIEAVPVDAEPVPADAEDKYCTILWKVKLNPVDNEAVSVDVEAVPLDGEEKYCTVKSETEPLKNEAVPWTAWLYLWTEAVTGQ